MSPTIDPISAKKALESMMGTDHLPREHPEREALDREELREAEYEEMGLHAPPASPTPTSLRDHLGRFLRRKR